MTEKSTIQDMSIFDNIAFLLGKSNQLKDRLLDKHLISEEITSTQARILFYIHKFKNNRPCDVGKALNVDNSAITRMIDRLVKKSLIQRTASPEDRRSVQIKLTEKGHQVVQQAVPLAINATAELTQCLTEEEKLQLRHCLKKILAPELNELIEKNNSPLKDKE